MTTTKYTYDLEQFRQSLYQNLNNRADTLMELVDAMCSTPDVRSIVEYSLAPCFRRSYMSLGMQAAGDEEGLISPTLVQRDFCRIIRQNLW